MDGKIAVRQDSFHPEGFPFVPFPHVPAHIPASPGKRFAGIAAFFQRPSQIFQPHVQRHAFIGYSPEKSPDFIVADVALPLFRFHAVSAPGKVHPLLLSHQLKIHKIETDIPGQIHILRACDFKTEIQIIRNRQCLFQGYGDASICHRDIQGPGQVLFGQQILLLLIRLKFFRHFGAPGVNRRPGCRHRGQEQDQRRRQRGSRHLSPFFDCSFLCFRCRCFPSDLFKSLLHSLFHRRRKTDFRL